MEYIYAALLLHKLNKEVNEENLSNVLRAAGATPDLARSKALVAALSEVKIEEVLKGATLAAVTSAPAPTREAPAEAPKEKAPEEKKEEKREEEVLAGLSSLFG